MGRNIASTHPLPYHTLHGCGDPAAPAIVLLHGLGSSSADWELQVPVFGQRYRVIAVDLPGHGRSPAAAGRLTVAAMADAVAALLASRGEPPAHVVGLSLGGCVAQLLALRHPERVRSLVLVNTFARVQPAGLRGLGRFLARLWLLLTAPTPRLAEYVARGLFPRPEQRALYEAAAQRLARSPRRTYLAHLRALAGFDVRGELGRLRCPTLIIAGDRDQTVPRAAIETLHRAIPGAQLRLIPDSGHATPCDQTEAFNDAVMRFVASTSGKSEVGSQRSDAGKRP